MISRSRIRRLEAVLSRSSDTAILSALEETVKTSEPPASGAARRVLDMIEARIEAREVWANENDEIEAMVEWARPEALEGAVS